MVAIDHQLSRVVIQNISTSLKMFQTRCMQMQSTSTETIQINSASYHLQLTNQAISNALYRMSSLISDMSTSLHVSDEVNSVLQLNITSLKEASIQCVQPLLNSIKLSMHEIICTMHRESFSGEDAGNFQGNIECSQFINDLQSFISRIQHDYLASDDYLDSMYQNCEQLVIYCIQAYVLNCCMVRPLGSLGVMKMTIDLTQLEVVLAPLYKERLSEIGLAYKMLRCLRKLIHTDLQELANSQHKYESLPRSYLLLQLISRADSSFRLPHQLTGSTLEQFSELAINSTDEEIISKIRDSLTDYEETISYNKSDQLSLPPVYPLIKQLLD